MGEWLALVVVLGLADYRLARIVTRDSISEPFRVALGQWATIGPYDVDDENDELRWRSRLHRYAHNLLTCPLCIGVWFAALMVLVFTGAPWEADTAGDWLITVLAVAGVQSSIVVAIDG